MHLQTLYVNGCKDVEVVFEIESFSSNSTDFTTTLHKYNHQPPPLLLPHLKVLNLEDMERMSDVWKCNWKKLVIPQNQSQSYSFHNLTKITMYNCKSIKYLFSPLMGKLLPNLKKVGIDCCDGIEEVVSNRDINYENEEIISSTHTNTISSFPLLHFLFLWNLPCLKGIDGDTTITTTSIHDQFQTQLPMCSTPDLIKLVQFPWSFSNLVEVDAQWSDKLLKSHIIFPCKELLNLKNLEKLSIINVHESKIEEVFEVAEGTNEDVDIETQSVVVFEKLKEVTLGGINNLKHMWKSNRWIVLNFPNLTKVSINKCPLLGHVFSSCMVGSLLQLQELKISYCQSMDVIVKQVEDSETRPTTTEVVFPCLKSITLHNLPNLKGFCLGKVAFEWPLLDTLEIKDCPQITVFTNGQSTTPELKLIDTTFGLCHVTEDPNSFIKTKQQEEVWMGVLEQHQIHTCGLVCFEVSYIAQLLAYYSFISGY
ncbi:hypothetical protein Lser_V15G05476 [Lactuca serriola]